MKIYKHNKYEMLFINLNHLADKWLKLKKQRIQNLFKIAQPDEALYVAGIQISMPTLPFMYLEILL